MGQKMATAVDYSVEEIQKLINDVINNNKVVVYSKSYCPYCNEVKKFLKSLNMEFIAIELDKEENGSAVQEELAKLTGQRTVPNVFVNGTNVGGCDKTKAAHSEAALLAATN